MRLKNKRDVGPATEEQVIITHWPIGDPETNLVQLNNRLQCFLIDLFRSLSTNVYGFYRPFLMSIVIVCNIHVGDSGTATLAAPISRAES